MRPLAHALECNLTIVSAPPGEGETDKKTERAADVRRCEGVIRYVVII
jgi:hypothetical protein